MLIVSCTLYSIFSTQYDVIDFEAYTILICEFIGRRFVSTTSYIFIYTRL